MFDLNERLTKSFEKSGVKWQIQIPCFKSSHGPDKKIDKISGYFAANFIINIIINNNSKNNIDNSCNKFCPLIVVWTGIRTHDAMNKTY